MAPFAWTRSECEAVSRRIDRPGVFEDNLATFLQKRRSTDTSRFRVDVFGLVPNGRLAPRSSFIFARIKTGPRSSPEPIGKRVGSHPRPPDGFSQLPDTRSASGVSPRSD